MKHRLSRCKASLWHQIGTAEVNYRFTIVRIPTSRIEQEPLGMPSHDSASGAALRFPLVDHGAARTQGIAGVNSAMERKLIDAQEKSARFAEIFH